MHIAQLSVAGEVGSRSQNTDVTTQSDDQQALDEYACDRSNLPWVIFRAAHRANHIAALPARARAVLAALARTVDAARPFAAIFARRELLTGRALQSMRTFYRSLEDLEAAGFITRPPQTRYGSAGLFGRAYLHLTAKAAAVLGLTDAESDGRTVSRHAARADARETAADILIAPSVTLADGAIYKDLNPHTQKRQPGRLPDDLTRLQPLGFREFLIFKLMREARQHGKRLSDVVETTWSHLKRATHPISYLRALLRKPVDFAYRMHTLRSETAERESRESRDVIVEERAKALRGGTFESRDGLTRYSVSEDASELTAHHRDEARPRVRIGAWAHDFIAALEAGHIVPIADEQRASAHVTRPVHARATDAPAAHVAPQSTHHVQAIKQMLRLKAAGIVPTSAKGDQEERSSPPRSAIPVGFIAISS
ncbi:replication protein O [Caballeronia sp. LZ062]|uniref:replication protein O n=1 Tax=unclassified Caballeronia TaxID=2646786 RepID=UPI0028591213|nr:MULTISPECIES: replication protein O [unclassified Caballeronia]MDR5856349.1 replication protein O [Caballeronia sp. LZ050]MDR5873019.1 replication protein O [Caballeronia sp. LZ062]